MCEQGTICSNCPYFREVETDYDIEIRCTKYDSEAHMKNKRTLTMIQRLCIWIAEKPKLDALFSHLN